MNEEALDSTLGGSGCPFCGFNRAYRTFPKGFRARLAASLSEQHSYRCSGCGKVYQSPATHMRRSGSDLGGWGQSARLAINKNDGAATTVSGSSDVPPLLESPAVDAHSDASGTDGLPAPQDIDLTDLCKALDAIDSPVLDRAVEPGDLELDMEESPRVNRLDD